MYKRQLLAFLYFHEQKVDLALIEVGIGGLLDTTNVITGEVAVITSVGLDHQETLGGSLEAIARQKAGIFKAGKPAVIGPLAKEAEKVCIEKAQAIGLSLIHILFLRLRVIEVISSSSREASDRPKTT